MQRDVTRRRFMKNVATVSGALMAGPYLISAGLPPSKRIMFAHIGTAGRGASHLNMSSINGAAVCFADVDKNRWPGAARGRLPQGFEKAVGYQDYRQMFDKHAKEIDAVVIAVPDQHHYTAAIRAVLLGKHVYVEKPMTWCVQEARMLTEAVVKMKVASQMGNQGHANYTSRIALAYIKSGVLGDIKEIHTWTNRPGWPQGLARPAGEDPVPANLDWNSWIGAAPMRPYKARWPEGTPRGGGGYAGVYCPGSWRGWFDVGAGAIGDMGCHTWDVPYWSMMPDYPTSLELLEIQNPSLEMFPTSAHFKWNYPAKGGRPAFEAHWYEGGLKPPVPEEMLNDPVRIAAAPPPALIGGGGRRGATTLPGGAGATTRRGAVGGGRGGAVGGVQLPETGSLYIGTKGKMLVGGDYSDSPRLIPESFHQANPTPPNIMERSPGHPQEWWMAIRGDKPVDYPGSNFRYSGNLAENMLLGTILQRIGKVGFKIECDPVARTIKTPEAQAFAQREYLHGWGV